MTLIQISYFISVCDNGSISKAARDLHVSQPAVSSAIKDLEEECGTALFLRQNSGLILTDSGRVFQSQAEEFLNHYQKMFQAVKLTGNADMSFDLGVVPMAGGLVMPRIYHDFHQRFPNIQMNIHEGQGTNDQLRILSNGSIDVAIVSGDVAGDEFHTMVIKQSHMLFCVSSRHPLSQQEKVTVPMIADEPLVLYERSFGQNKMVAGIYAKYGYIPHVVYRTAQLAIVEKFVQNGSTAGFLYEDIATEIPGVVGFQLDDLDIVNITMVWKKHHYLSYGARQFIQCVKELSEYL